MPREPFWERSSGLEAFIIISGIMSILGCIIAVITLCYASSIKKALIIKKDSDYFNQNRSEYKQEMETTIKSLIDDQICTEQMLSRISSTISFMNQHYHVIKNTKKNSKILNESIKTISNYIDSFDNNSDNRRALATNLNVIVLNLDKGE